MTVSDFKVVWGSEGNIARTFNFTDASPTWENIKGSILGNVNDADFDWQSDFFSSYFDVIGAGAYVVTTSGSTLRVYHTEDIQAESITWELQDTFTMNDSSVVSSARIAVSKTEPQFAMLAWKDQTGTLYL